MSVHNKLRSCSDEEYLELFGGKERRLSSLVFVGDGGDRLVVTVAVTAGVCEEPLTTEEEERAIQEDILNH